MKVESQITEKMLTAFSPAHLEVINESGNHNVPPGSESHFKLIVVSDAFAGKRAVQRHQLIYAELAEELKSGVHALALHSYTPEEWVQVEVAASPECLGGSKR